VRIEDDVLVTESGVELLTHVTTALLEVQDLSESSD
jgi:Xaa-Pro aminopeptidase